MLVNVSCPSLFDCIACTKVVCITGSDALAVGISVLVLGVDADVMVGLPVLGSFVPAL